MDSKKILDYLYGLESPKIKLGLGRIQMLLDRIGNPERGLRCIHVAGTNGKGSVCAMIFHVLKGAGYKVGLYTSPHLKRFNERIIVDGRLINDEEIANYFLRVKPSITDQSFFEITTAMAFLYFKEKKADFVVLETGLGGRLDATNVVNPLISVITNVDLEHTNLLGNTVEKIAFEKAGIIKHGRPVVTASSGKALSVIKKISKQKSAPLFLARRYPQVKFRFLNGEYQQNNKDIALTSIGVLKEYCHIKLSQKQIMTGIKKTRWRGRLEFISKNVLIDSAHNPSGFKVLEQELKAIKKQKRIEKFIFVIGIQNDKDYAAMLKAISPLASKIIFTKSDNKKALNPGFLSSAFQKINKKTTIEKVMPPGKALSHAKRLAGKKDLIVMAGSIYMVGEVI